MSTVVHSSALRNGHIVPRTRGVAAHHQADPRHDLGRPDLSYNRVCVGPPRPPAGRRRNFDTISHADAHEPWRLARRAGLSPRLVGQHLVAWSWWAQLDRDTEIAAIHTGAEKLLKVTE